MVVGAKVCHLTEDILWFVCGFYVGILTSSLILWLYGLYRGGKCISSVYDGLEYLPCRPLSTNPTAVLCLYWHSNYGQTSKIPRHLDSGKLIHMSGHFKILNLEVRKPTGKHC